MELLFSKAGVVRVLQCLPRVAPSFSPCSMSSCIPAARPTCTRLPLLPNTLFALCTRHVVGHVYPAYASYKAVKSGDPAEHRQWLMYWTVNTLLSVIEALLDMVASWYVRARGTWQAAGHALQRTAFETGRLCTRHDMALPWALPGFHCTTRPRLCS